MVRKRGYRAVYLWTRMPEMYEPRSSRRDRLQALLGGATSLAGLFLVAQYNKRIAWAISGVGAVIGFTVLLLLSRRQR